MRIRRLELRGFKSFVDRTTLQLGPGISGVVGPNGCGKSNVIDAIRWTLGEQSPRTLRGEQMADVIFSGAEGRRPAGMAEVSIAFDNSDGSFGGRFARFEEIEVGRRLYRDGGSDYLLNKAQCRRKDIVELFLDTGVGARAYSIIEQGRVDFVVSARPEERRVLVDEVAGINRFKRQRADAERRLSSTRDNLVRLADLLDEMGRQRRSLQAQATRARRYRELRAAWGRAALGALAGAGLAQQERLATAKAELVELKATEQKARAELDSASGAAAALRERSGEARRRHDRLRDRRAEVDAGLELLARERQLRKEELRGVERRVARASEEEAELARSRSAGARELKGLREASEASRGKLEAAEASLLAATDSERSARAAARAAHAAVEALKAEQLSVLTAGARAKNQATLLAQQLAGLRESLDRGTERTRELLAAREASREALAGAEAALDAAVQKRAASLELLRRNEARLVELRAAVEAASAALAAAQDGQRRRAAKLASLQGLIDSHEGFGEGAKAVAEALGPVLVGAVVDLLEPEPGAEVAVELALGERLEGLVVSSIPGAREQLPESIDGRVLLVPADGAPAAEPDSLAGRVADDASPGLAARLLGASTVEPSGGVRTSDGLWVGGGGTGSSLLAMRRDARELEAAISGAAESLEASRAAAATARQELATATSASEEQARAAHELELQELSRRRDLDEARASSKRAQRGVEEREAEGRRLERDIATRAEELAGVEEAAAEAERTASQLQAKVGDARAAAETAERALEGAAGAATAGRVELARAQQDAATTQRDLRRAETTDSDLARRVARLAADSEASTARRDELTRRLVAVDEEEAALKTEQSALAKELEAAAAAREETAGRWRRAEDEARQHQRRLEDVTRRSGACEVRFAESRTALQGVHDRAAEQFDIDLAAPLKLLSLTGRATLEGRGSVHVVLERDEVCAKGATERLQAEASKLRGKLDGMGPVNLAADAEFQEVDARFTELEGQRDDLEQAMTDLRRAIAKIEQETRERFKQAFEAVTARFSDLYPRLVGGGRAELRLTDPKDLLGTGIDIVVEPPGKRLQNLQLLSGGEKAMAAIALVFAIFQVKPSPFCLLDEVDAPLDDANSRRMGALLREMSAETQFVVITHNRTTMEVADVLYGVTMQKPGVSSVVAVQMDQPLARR